MNKSILIIIFLSTAVITTVTLASSLSVTKTWSSGETLNAADLNNSFNEVETAVSDNDARITAIAPQKYLTLNPYGALLGGGAIISSGFGANSGIKFPDSVTSSFGMGFVIPPNYVSGDAVTVNLLWHTASINCGIVFAPNSIAVARAGQTHLIGGSATTGLSVVGGNTLTAPATANQSSIVQLSIIAPDGTSLDAGDSVIFNMYRSSSSLGDTCTADLVVQGVSVMY